SRCKLCLTTARDMIRLTRGTEHGLKERGAKSKKRTNKECLLERPEIGSTAIHAERERLRAEDNLETSHCADAGWVRTTVCVRETRNFGAPLLPSSACKQSSTGDGSGAFAVHQYHQFGKQAANIP